MIDFKKPIESTSGHKVTIFTTQAKGHFPVIGQIHDRDHSIGRWTKDGIPCGYYTRPGIRNVQDQQITVVVPRGAKVVFVEA